MEIKGNGKQQKKALVRKLKVLKELENSYREIFPLKQLDWILAALFRIGELYRNVAESFINAPCPKAIKLSAKELELTVDEVCDEYAELLQEKAMPIEDKAVAAYELTVERAKEFQIANEWTRKNLHALNKLRPDEWPIHRDVELLWDSNAVETPQIVDWNGDDIKPRKVIDNTFPEKNSKSRDSFKEEGS